MNDDTKYDLDEIKRNIERNRLINMYENSYEPITLRVSKIKDKRMQLAVKLVIWTIIFDVASTFLDLWANHIEGEGPIALIGGTSTILGLLALISICMALAQLFRARTAHIRKEIRDRELP